MFPDPRTSKLNMTVVFNIDSLPTHPPTPFLRLSLVIPAYVREHRTALHVRYNTNKVTMIPQANRLVFKNPTKGILKNAVVLGASGSNVYCSS